MQILIVGSGGREHAIGWKLAQSPQRPELYFAPGNGGTSKIGTNIPIGVKEVDQLSRFALEFKIDLTIASSDDSLALGIVDAFQAKGLKIFGPTREAAKIEWSKAFAKELMTGIGVPTAPFKTFNMYVEAREYIRRHGAPIVVKVSGLALGKGAYVCKTVEDAENVLYDIMIARIHGDAGEIVIIEDFIEGPEASIHAFCDGPNFVLAPLSRDHKPALDNDEGENTGGMGTYAPVPEFTEKMMQEVSEKIVGPILRELARLGTPFVGILYPGLKITPNGLVVLEINARPGDPETQSYMRLLKTDLLDILMACVNGSLDKINVEWHPGFAVCIVAASGGYPGDYKKEFPITGIEEAEKNFGIVVFQAGTKLRDDGILTTSGGRVLGVSATGNTLGAALTFAYLVMNKIRFEGIQYRRDIGAKYLEADKWLKVP